MLTWPAVSRDPRGQADAGVLEGAGACDRVTAATGHSLASRWDDSRVIRSATMLLTACLLLQGCDDKKADEAKTEEAKTEEIKWPEKPADGSNLAVEVLAVEDDGAKVKAYNFADKEVTQISLRQRYLDEAGKEVGTFPFMWMGSVDPKSVEEFKTVIMSKPDGMKTVGFVVRKVKYADGTEWKLEE